MPNQPKTPTRSLRIPDDVWLAVQQRAEQDGVSATDVVREALRLHLRPRKVTARP